MAGSSADGLARWTRREFVRRVGAGLALVSSGCRLVPGPRQRFDADPFALGVASGSPLPDGVVLWTRLAPAPLEPDGGLPPERIRVRWSIAEDERLTRGVRSGSAEAFPELGHSVHLELRGLEPDRPYWYRFECGGAQSPLGRTRTAPAPGSSPARLRFAYASCQHYERGYFNAYSFMLQDELNFVVHLGDYIYENAASEGGVRRHDGPEPDNIIAYRARHALYKTDRDLQAAHAAYPWITTWDDHEVQNDYAGDLSEDGGDPALFRARRSAAYQAYYEHMPIWSRALVRPATIRIWQRLGFGDLLEMSVVDTRQYRTDQPCGEPGKGGGQLVENCAARLSPAQTLLGAEQEAWLLEGLAASRSRWNLIAQQLLMASFDHKLGPGEKVWTDGWDGYAADRERILGALAERRVANVISIGGDIHSFWATELRPAAVAQDSPPVAAEFVGTSISSTGVPYDEFAAALPENPHVRFFESRQRGYALCDVTPARWQTDFRAVASVRDPQTTATTLASFTVEPGRSTILKT